MFHVRLAMTALRALHQNLLRSFLATLGVIIGVGAVVAAVTLLESAQHNILGKFESLGADQVIVVNGTDNRQHRNATIQSLEPDDARMIERENPDVILGTAPQCQGAGQIKYLARNAFATVLGTTEAFQEINSYEPVDGRFLTKQDVAGRTMVCVLGHKVAKELFGPKSPVGRTVKINGKSFAIVGVMEERGTIGFWEVDKWVFIPLSTAMERMFGQRYLSMLVAQCQDAKKLPVCIERVKKTLRAAHRIKAGQDDDFVVFTQEQVKQGLTQVTSILAVVFYGIAGISLLVGAIGIMNIMLVSVTERTREIGVRIACGARRFDILKQFLIEAGIISAFGGALGVVCGWAIANFISKFTQLLEIYVPPMIIVVALIMAAAVGIVSGIYPALRAASLDPVESLRFE